MNSIVLSGLFSGSVWEIVGNTSTFGVIILTMLIFMSLVSWVIIFHKWRQFRAVERDSDQFIQYFRRARRISDASDQARSFAQSPLANICTVGTQELASLFTRKNGGGESSGGAKTFDATDFEILEMTMERTLTEEMGKLEQQVVFLATTSSAAPFMGLLGTVVGIMDSFWSIGERGNASLAIVAPGIAEALLATIVGLGAAIPAVIAFNWANNKTKFLNDRSAGFILEFLARAKKESI